MKEIFLAILEKIKADVPAVRWIDFDLGQLDEEHPPVSFPCVLIGFNDGDFIDLSQGAQQGDISVNLRIAFRNYERTHSVAVQNFQAVGLSHLDILKAVHTAINGLSGTEFSALARRNFNNEKRSDLRVFNVGYETLLRETVASPYQLLPLHQQPYLCIKTEPEGISHWIIEEDFVVS